MKYKKVRYKYTVTDGQQYQTGIMPNVPAVNQFYVVAVTGLVTVFPGYSWDGSTGAEDTPESMSASLVHDICCQAVQEGTLDKKWKRRADFEYFWLCVKNGMSKTRSLVRWVAISFHDWENTPPNTTEFEVP